jgi:hypothetical protein
VGRLGSCGWPWSSPSSSPQPPLHARLALLCVGKPLAGTSLVQPCHTGTPGSRHCWTSRPRWACTFGQVSGGGGLGGKCHCLQLCTWAVRPWQASGGSSAQTQGLCAPTPVPPLDQGTTFAHVPALSTGASAPKRRARGMKRRRAQRHLPLQARGMQQGRVECLGAPRTPCPRSEGRREHLRLCVWRTPPVLPPLPDWNAHVL